MQWINKNKLIISIAAICMLLIVSYCLSDSVKNEDSSKLNYVDGTKSFKNIKSKKNRVNNKIESEIKNPETIAVYLCGKVKQVGVIKVKSGEVLSDIIKENGGFVSGADYNRINLARAPKNGEKIYIPYVGEKDLDIKKYNSDVTLSTNVTVQAQGIQSTVASNQSGEKQNSNSNNKVNINTANESLLETVPNIGPSRAKAIIDYRTKNGAFKSVNDLDNVNRIGKKIIDGMKDYICIQ
jgi:competence protein ComEA